MIYSFLFLVAALWCIFISLYTKGADIYFIAVAVAISIFGGILASIIHLFLQNESKTKQWFLLRLFLFIGLIEFLITIYFFIHEEEIFTIGTSTLVSTLLSVAVCVVTIWMSLGDYIEQSAKEIDPKKARE